MDSDNSIPLFCVQTSDKKVNKKLFVNFRASNKVEYPKEDIDEDQLVKEFLESSSKLERFKIPFYSSVIFWSKGKESDRCYVVDVTINDRFARTKVLASDVLRHYVITVVMSALEKKYNTEEALKSGQFLGHKLELDFLAYEVLTKKQSTDRTNEVVNNKIMLIEESKNQPTIESDDQNFDLHYRPASKFLTLSLNTDRIPDCIKFNEDRLIVNLGEKTLVDVYLPIHIDLDQPVKYKFDERLCLFRAVFKVAELVDPINVP